MEGIDFLHKNGICHRDIKPSNLLITKQKKIYIVDFNVSRKKESDGSEFKIMTRAGTLAFSAPEILMNKHYE